MTPNVGLIMIFGLRNGEKKIFFKWLIFRSPARTLLCFTFTEERSLLVEPMCISGRLVNFQLLSFDDTARKIDILLKLGIKLKKILGIRGFSLPTLQRGQELLKYKSISP